jgi:hypothetical protein
MKKETLGASQGECCFGSALIGFGLTPGVSLSVLGVKGEQSK